MTKNGNSSGSEAKTIVAMNCAGDTHRIGSGRSFGLDERRRE
jgi:hypothetical protein